MAFLNTVVSILSTLTVLSGFSLFLKQTHTHVPAKDSPFRDKIDTRVLRKKWEIDYEELILESKIGSGNFGVVWKVSYLVLAAEVILRSLLKKQ